ncbi:hypothetical protein [uncultured Tateyamaria sp.]|uniref:hypothetical protein n=1 Tax=uncultured Tateyamaria sp. TaxID=455651 RepID=UPI00260FAE5A|nr:hypothetical protein [uncultured Tateyamaria sp.]
MPNQLGARQLTGPKGKAYLWLETELFGFGADGLLDVSGEDRPTLEDILFLDVLPDTPATLDDDPDADDAYAYTSRVMQKYMLCVDPETWSVRRSPLFSLKNMQEYAIQSGFPTRMDFELQDARRAWMLTKDFAGAQLAMSFEYEKKPNEFRRPSEIARLVEKELGKLCVKPGKAKEEIFAEAYLNAFRGLSVSEQHLFTQAKAREISVPGFSPFNSNSSTGFVKAWSAFKGALTDDEFGRLPSPGRPRNPRT